MHRVGEVQGRLKVERRAERTRIGLMVSYLLVFLIKIYQITLGLVFPSSCRFHPSCSEYAAEAFRRFGPIKAGRLSLKRLSKCHPFNPGGFDPLP